jgi:hypothetical protein
MDNSSFRCPEIGGQITIRSANQQPKERKTITPALRTFQKQLQSLRASVKTAEESERKQMVKELEKFMKSIVS